MSADADEPDPDVDAGERPPIEDDERAELDVEGLAERVEAAAGRSAEPDADADEDADEVDESADEDAAELMEGAATWGDKYVALLALSLAGVVRKYGELDVEGDLVDEHGGELQAKAAEIMELGTFGPLDLANDFNRLLAKHGGPSDIPPEVAVLLGTVALSLVVVATETDLLADALEDLEGEA